MGCKCIKGCTAHYRSSKHARDHAWSWLPTQRHQARKYRMEQGATAVFIYMLTSYFFDVDSELFFFFHQMGPP